MELQMLKKSDNSTEKLRNYNTKHCSFKLGAVQKRVNLVAIERKHKMSLKQLSCKSYGFGTDENGPSQFWVTTDPSPPHTHSPINSYVNAGERALGAKIPTPFFFIASAFFLNFRTLILTQLEQKS